jgi:predicted DNA binding CopG/RHH family protein
MKNNVKGSEILLDEEEKLLLSSFENDEWERIKNFDQEKEKALNAANNYLKKDMRINIRISGSDLKRIKQKAAYEGLPYQTLITSILHKYSAGHN